MMKDKMLAIDLSDYPYPSKRAVVLGSQGMVATSQPLAAQAGMEALRQGGNAIDAAIAAAAALTVVAPTMCGIGGDVMAMINYHRKTYVLNGSGCSPEALSPDLLRDRGCQSIERTGPLSITVPGAPRAWADLSARLGRLPLRQTLRPAIEYAREGYPVNELSARAWRRHSEIYASQRGRHLEGWFSCFAPNGVTPKAGQIWQSRSHALTLNAIAETDSEEFYSGSLAGKIVDAVQTVGGVLSRRDLWLHKSTWEEPIQTDYRGYTISQASPNSQGLISLLALRILNGWNVEPFGSTNAVHTQIEAIKLAFALGYDLVAGRHGDRITEVLRPDAIATLRDQLIPNQANPSVHLASQGGTVCVASADSEGNMVSMLQSNFYGFGSGVVVPDTGIALNCRASAFTLDPARADYLCPGARPFHTLAPTLVSQGDDVIGALGVIGASMQPQGHVQLLTNMLDHGMNPQAAIDAPRWEWEGGTKIALEQRFPPQLTHGLQALGHQAYITAKTALFGRAQIILKDQDGVLIGGTDYRADGQVAAF